MYDTRKGQLKLKLKIRWQKIRILFTIGSTYVSLFSRVLHDSMTRYVGRSVRGRYLFFAVLRRFKSF